MHGFEMMRAVSPSLNKSVFDLLLHQGEKRSCKNPTPRHMPDDRSFSHQQQRTNKSHVVEQNWRGFEPEEWPMAGMQALSPTHSPYSATNARNQIYLSRYFFPIVTVHPSIGPVRLVMGLATHIFYFLTSIDGSDRMPKLASVDYRLSTMFLLDNFVPVSIESILFETHSSIIDHVNPFDFASAS